jgi:MerR family transcriptional regulator, copper efflux regulator
MSPSNLDTLVLGFVAEVDALTVNEAAATTGWSARMLRYVEQAGLVVPPRSAAGYRLFGPGELQRLRTLRELLERHEVGLAEVGFARRLDEDAGLRAAVQEWLAARPQRPLDVPADEWLRFEQRKHERLLAA